MYIVQTKIMLCRWKQIVVTWAEQKVFHLVQFAPYYLSQYHFYSFTSRAGIYRGRHFCRIVIIWQNSHRKQNGYSCREQLARDVNQFEQTLFAFADCRHQPANHVSLFDSVVLMAGTMPVPVVLMAPRTKRGSGGIPTKPYLCWKKGCNWVYAIFTISSAF